MEPEALVVVLVQEGQGQRVIGDDPEEPLGLDPRHGPFREDAAHEVHGTLEFPEPLDLGLKALLVDGVSLEDMVPEGLGGPDAKLGPAQ
jgi:hypothetical protein